jgi:hypothetical protein
MKRFKFLSDDKLNIELKRLNEIIEGYQKPIDKYDYFYKKYEQTRKDDYSYHHDNPIVSGRGVYFKYNPRGGVAIYVNGYQDEVITIKECYGGSDDNGLYVLTKEGCRIVYSQKMHSFVNKKRQIELIFRGRKKDKEKKDNEGYVYVLSNKSLPPNTYKIGSTYGNPEERAEELTGTGHLTPFKVEFSIEIKNAEFYEKKIHSLLNGYRVKQNREFFELDLDTIKNCLKQVSAISEKGSKQISLDVLKKEVNV